MIDERILNALFLFAIAVFALLWDEVWKDKHNS